MTTTIKGWCAYNKRKGWAWETFIEAPGFLSEIQKDDIILGLYDAEHIEYPEEYIIEEIVLQAKQKGWTVRPCKMTIEPTDITEGNE